MNENRKRIHNLAHVWKWDTLKNDSYITCLTELAILCRVHVHLLKQYDDKITASQNGLI